MTGRMTSVWGSLTELSALPCASYLNFSEGTSGRDPMVPVQEPPAMTTSKWELLAVSCWRVSL